MCFGYALNRFEFGVLFRYAFVMWYGLDYDLDMVWDIVWFLYGFGMVCERSGFLGVQVVLALKKERETARGHAFGWYFSTGILVLMWFWYVFFKGRERLFRGLWWVGLEKGKRNSQTPFPLAKFRVKVSSKLTNTHPDQEMISHNPSNAPV